MDLKSIDRFVAIKKAEELIASDPLFLDTETTGLDDDATVVEISVLDIAGNVVFHSLINPMKPIPAIATSIHGITNEDVENAPVFTEIMDDLIRIFKGRIILIYNEDYDVRLILQTALQSGGLTDKYHDLYSLIMIQENATTDCVMHLYAQYRGIESDRGGYKWHKLVTAAESFGVDTSEAHRATADCLMTIAVLKGIANAND